MNNKDLVKIAKIVDSEVRKVIPDLFKKVKKRLLKETNLKIVKQIKANKNRPCLGDFCETDEQVPMRSGKKGRTLTEAYDIKFLSFSYPDKRD